MERAECPFKDVLSFHPPVGADRRGGEIGHTEVGGASSRPQILAG